MEPQVISAAKDFVPVRVDSDQRKDLVRTWKIRELPGLVFLSPEGGVLAQKIEPLFVAGDIVNLAKKALAVLAQTRALEQAVQGDPKDARKAKALADACFKQHLWDRCAELFEKVLALDPQDAAGVHESSEGFLVYADLLREHFEAAEKRATAFEGRYPKSERLPEVLYWRGLCLARLKRAPEAFAVWQQVVKDFPDHDAAKLARESLRRAGK